MTMPAYSAYCPVAKRNVGCDSIIRLRSRIARTMMEHNMTGTIRIYAGSRLVGTMIVSKNTITYSAKANRKARTRILKTNGRIDYTKKP